VPAEALADLVAEPEAAVALASVDEPAAVEVRTEVAVDLEVVSEPVPAAVVPLPAA
jgi:hypothetical protein